MPVVAASACLKFGHKKTAWQGGFFNEMYLARRIMALQPIFINTPSHQPLIQPVAGPWPTYGQCRHLPEQDRWQIYESAKAYRRMLEDTGFRMAETYDQFIKRVTDELEI